MRSGRNQRRAARNCKGVLTIPDVWLNRAVLRQGCVKGSRTHLSQDDSRPFIGRLYNSRKKSRGGDHGNQYLPNPQNEGKPNTAEQIANDHGTSRATVERAGKQAEAIDNAAPTPRKRSEPQDHLKDSIDTNTTVFRSPPRGSDRPQITPRIPSASAMPALRGRQRGPEHKPDFSCIYSRGNANPIFRESRGFRAPKKASRAGVKLQSRTHQPNKAGRRDGSENEQRTTKKKAGRGVQLWRAIRGA